MRLILFIFFIIFCVVILSSFNQQNLSEFMSDYGKFGWAIYIGFWVILPIFLFPAGILAIGGGAILGFWEALICAMIGVGINSAIMYFIARYFSGAFDTAKFERVKNKFCKDEFSLIILLRLIPIVPYNVVNYMAGALRFDFVKFIIAGVLGKLISAVLFINLGSNITNYKSYEFWLALLLVVLMGAVAFWVRKILNRRVG
ncbi:TVP38/TMEM64 family protein [Campylobacter porcelli]|uniref:TVP38/TMEM64 family membrane protein n=1 Tax=Campylobacter porcelli TaxID=1660073 RepID=A0A1X9SVE0_9BACT|nr:VTT domain-containing protein [Campylobacter sp. RM6137]ARR00201.1 putative membrane protein, YdjX family (SNARE domain) [Campylobacter sp. RM6137]